LNRINPNVGDAKSFGIEVGTELNVIKNWSNFIGLNLYNYQIDGVFDDRPVNKDATILSINLNYTIEF